jgi:hypothetical protein
MWFHDSDDDQYLTPEEQNARYLQQNPNVEIGLWAEWVMVCCTRDRIPPPTEQEWTQLRAKFYHGKAPVDSVVELKHLRGIS